MSLERCHDSVSGVEGFDGESKSLLALALGMFCFEIKLGVVDSRTLCFLYKLARGENYLEVSYDELAVGLTTSVNKKNRMRVVRDCLKSLYKKQDKLNFRLFDWVPGSGLRNSSFNLYFVDIINNSVRDAANISFFDKEPEAAVFHVIGSYFD